MSCNMMSSLLCILYPGEATSREASLYLLPSALINPIETIQAFYKEFYKEHPFTVIADKPIALKQVVNTNKCVIYIEKEGNKIVVAQCH